MNLQILHEKVCVQECQTWKVTCTLWMRKKSSVTISDTLSSSRLTEDVDDDLIFKRPV